MQYLIAYMIRGRAGEYHRALSGHVADRFGLLNVGSGIDPHLTLKAPFTACAERLRDIEALIEGFAKDETSEPLFLSGYGAFRERLIYMNVVAPRRTHSLLIRFQDTLRRHAGLPFSAQEFPLVLHATLARAQHPDRGREMLTHLRRQPRASFALSLDRISLLAKHEHWEVVQEFRMMERSTMSTGERTFVSR